MPLSYDVVLAPATVGTYLDCQVSPVPVATTSLTVVYTSLAGATIATKTADHFSLITGGIRWTIDGSLLVVGNSGMTYVISDGATVLQTGRISVIVPPTAAGSGTGLTAIADQTALGNISGASAVPVALTATQFKTLLALVKGDVGLGNVDNTSDASKATTERAATATLTNKRVTKRIVTLTDASTTAINNDNGDDFYLLTTSAVGATRALGAPSGSPVDGDQIRLAVKQPASGGPCALTYNAIYRFSSDLPSPTLSSGANKTDYLLFRYHGTDTKWDFLGLVRGF